MSSGEDKTTGKIRPYKASRGRSDLQTATPRTPHLTKEFVATPEHDNDLLYQVSDSLGLHYLLRLI